jgi:hypothetical protein
MNGLRVDMSHYVRTPQTSLREIYMNTTQQPTLE